MVPDILKKQIRFDDQEFVKDNGRTFSLPDYFPQTHYLELTHSGYFQALIVLRHYIKIISDYYFGSKLLAKNVDLFMLTPSVSSPMGPGSDSEAISIRFGENNTYLVDSSQFGFEPLLLNGLDIVYCYLPSMRGEDPDKRHLNQFFHCEAEIRGDINKLIPIIENYIRILAESLLLMPVILSRLSSNYEKTLSGLNLIVKTNNFPSIEFDDAVKILVENGYEKLINSTEFGRDITADGEIKLCEILKYETPFWLCNYDRDRVAFYQKPDFNNPNKVVNRDLIFPPIVKGAFGGEIVGCGQRQNSSEQILESLDRQGIKADAYQWYIDLRKLPNYKTTSGFGLGIERFITWSLCRQDIKDSIVYPRLKNTMTCP